jgi:predicted nucleotide-binding protein
MSCTYTKYSVKTKVKILNTSTQSKIEEIIKDGDSVENYYLFNRWYMRTYNFLKAAIGDDSAKYLSKNLSDEHSREEWPVNLSAMIGYLEGISSKISQSNKNNLTTNDNSVDNLTKTISTKLNVFIVHGHDTEAKESTARFLGKIGLEPIILHEQANNGQAIIEKFERHADVGFAVILLTPDDFGKSKSVEGEGKSRARQNVVFEMGYFIGKLSRKKVCALYKTGIEIPSDIAGLLYIEMDLNGAWKTKLAQELVAAGYSIDLSGLLTG